MSLSSDGRKSKKRRREASVSRASGLTSNSPGDLSQGQRRRVSKPPSRKKGGRAARRLKKWREAKLFLIVIAICLGAAFVSTFLLKADMRAVAKYLLFGSTDPYLSPDKSKSIESEFREEMKRLIK